MSQSATITGSMKLFTSRFSVMILSLAFYSIAAHVAPKAELAPLAAMAIIAELFRVTRSMGMTSTMLRDVPEHVALAKPDEARSLVQSTLLYTTLAGVALAALAWLLRSHLFTSGLLGADLLIILAFAWLMGIYDALQTALLALQRFGRQSLAYFITMAAQRLSAIVLLFAYGVTGSLVGFLIGAAIGVVVSLFWAREYVFGAMRLMSLRRLASYSAPYYVQGFARYVFQEGDQLIVGIFLPREVLVSFFLAKRIVHGVRMMIDSATDALRPKMGELRTRGEEAVRAGFSKSSRFLSYLALPVTLGVAAISPSLMRVYAGPRYADAGLILCVLSVAMAFYAYFSLYEVGIYMLGRPAQRLYVDLFAGGVMLASFALLTGPLGGLGIALGELVGFALGLVFSVGLLRDIIDARLDRRTLGRCLLATGMMAIVVGGTSLCWQRYEFIPFIVVLGMLIYLILLGALIFVIFFTQFFTKRDMDEIRDVLPRSFGICVTALERIGRMKAETDTDKETP